MAIVHLLALIGLCFGLVLSTSAPHFPKSCVSITQSRLPAPTYENTILYGYVYLRLEVAGPYWCARRCLQQTKCKSFNYHVPSSTCQLNSAWAAEDPGALVISQDFIHYHRSAIPTYFLGACEGHSCHPEALCQPVNHENYTCICQNKAFSVNNCSHTLPTDACTDLPEDYCLGGGRCEEDENGNATCVCPPGLSGPRCDDLVCSGFAHADPSPVGITQEAKVTWRNDAGQPADLLWIHADGTERYAVTVPAAAERNVSAMADYVWIARDRETRNLLPVNGICSLLVPDDRNILDPIITAA